MKKQVSVLVGAGSIGQAIIRRVSAGKHVILADYSLEHAEQAAKTLENAGFECSTIKCDLGSKEDILEVGGICYQQRRGNECSECCRCFTLSGSSSRDSAR